MPIFSSDKFKQLQMQEKTNKTHTILLVDDESANLRTLSMILGKYYHVLTASDGQAALALIQSLEKPGSIHCILSDQRMPNMTGIEFLSHTIPIIPDSIRIILTGFTDVEAIIDAVNKGGIYKYLTKPIDAKSLLLTVRRCLEVYDLEAEKNSLIQQLENANKTLEQKVEERTVDLLSKNVELTKLIELKNHFLGMAAHDLRNPLSAIKGYSELLVSDDVIDDIEKKLFYENIYKSSCYMFNLINDILDISTIESGRFELNYKLVAFDQLIKERVSLIEIIAKKKNISFNTALDPMPKIMIDAHRMIQVIDNLLTNALKFSHHDKRVCINLKRSDVSILFSVEDQGQGISADEIDRLFVAFQKLSAKPTAGEKSTGLGMSIVKNIVEAHGGRIEVISAVGVGTTFTVTIPLQMPGR